MSFPPQRPGPQGPWGQQPQQPQQSQQPQQPQQPQGSQQSSDAGYCSSQDPSQDFWRQVAAGQQQPQQAHYQQSQYPQQQYPPLPHPPPGASGDRRAVGLIVGLAVGGLVLVVGGALVAVLALTGSGGSSEEAAPVAEQPTSEPQPTTGTPLAVPAQPGDCLDIGVENSDPVLGAECGSLVSDHEVVETVAGEHLDRCVDNHGITWEGTTYCMVLDVKPGDCLTSYREDSSWLPSKVDCSAPGTEDRVTKVVDVNDPEAVCPEGNGWYGFGNPPRTVCFGPLQDS